MFMTPHIARAHICFAASLGALGELHLTGVDARHADIASLGSGIVAVGKRSETAPHRAATAASRGTGRGVGLIKHRVSCLLSASGGLCCGGGGKLVDEYSDLRDIVRYIYPTG